MGRYPINGIRIRLARHGQRNQPLYHIVAIQAGKAREARPLEKLGEYDPIARVRNTDFIPAPNRIFGKETVQPPLEKTVSWDLARIKWWIGQGAEPTGTVRNLLDRVSIGAMVEIKVANQQAGILENSAWKSKSTIADLRKKYASKQSPSVVEKAKDRPKDTTKEYLAELENRRWPVVQKEMASTTATSS